MTTRVVLALALALTPSLGDASPESRAWVDKAFAAAYNLDHPEAIASLDKALAADPNDPDAHRAAAVIAWLRIGFLRGSITVDDYLGSVSKPNINMLPPRADEANRFHRHIARALQLAEAEVQRRPRDPEAHFRLGAAVGTQASYGATVEGKILSSFRSARRAYDAHETVLELNPNRKDAGLIVGTYRYVVSALSLPIRLMAYVAGFGGGKERGLMMIEEASNYPSLSQTDARFALTLLYNREKRFDDALRVIQTLQKQYARNRQLWYEAGATLIRAGRYAEAESVLNDGIRMRDNDQRERMFGEDALWHYKRGVARARQGKTDPAREDFQIPLTREARHDRTEGRQSRPGAPALPASRRARHQGQRPHGAGGSRSAAPPGEVTYSLRSARKGSMRIADRAGMRFAARATSISRAPAPANATGSTLLMP
jgi:tetratricopeptide (TPR) repeat protein